MTEGTVALTNDVTIEIDEDCEVVVDPGQDGSLRVEASPGVLVGGQPQINLKNGAYLTVHSGDYSNIIPLKNSGGTFTIESGATASFAGQVDKQVGNPAYLQTAGITRLYYGAELISDMTMSGGKLAAIEAAFEDTSYITGDLKITGGEIFIGYGSGPHAYGQLYITGNVTWTGGTYRPVLDGEVDMGESDFWTTTGTLTVGGTAALAPGAIDGESNIILPDHADMHWELLFADGGITVNNNPAITGPWVIDPMPANPVKEWNLKST
jgi:hypothetical protein